MITIVRNMLLEIVFMTVVEGILGNVELNCETPSLSSNMTCVCKNTDRSDIDWEIKGIPDVSCFVTTTQCTHFPSGYKFTVEQTTNASYFLATILNYSYTNCGKYICKDPATATAVPYTTDIIDFDARTPTAIVEPATNHTNGDIMFTTECLYHYSYMKTEIYKIVGGVESVYKSGLVNISRINDISCMSCNGDAAVRLQIGFYHEESINEEKEEVQFRITAYHEKRPANILTLTTKNFYYVSTDVKDEKDEKDVKDCHICIIIIIILAVRFQSIQTLFSGYSLYKTFPKDGLKTSTCEYKWMGFLACIPFVGLIITAFREINICMKKQVSISAAEHPSLCYKFIGSSFATLIDPAFGMCVSSLLFASANKVTIADSWIFILSLIIGCLFVIGIEVLMLIPCEVFCWDEIYHVPLMILYLVILWLYLTFAVMYLKTTIGKDVCSTCGRNPSYECQICGKLMCDRCRRYHKHNTEISPRGEENTFICKSCRKKVNSYCMTCEAYLCVICMKLHERCGHGLLRHQQHNEEREREFCCDSCKEAGHHISAAHAFCLTCRAYSCTLCLNAKHKACTLLWIQEQSVETGQGLCCERIEDHREMPLEGVCLTCKSYICTRCLNSPKKHRTHRVSSHQQEHSTTGRRLHMCGGKNYTKEVQKTINYCLDCKDYLCSNCFTIHRQHRLFCYPSIDTPEPTSEILCKGCEKYKRLPVECYNTHNDEFLCAKCFERDHKSSPWKRTQYQNSDTLSFKKDLKKQQLGCQIHSVLGKTSASHVEVYCLVCKIYMCRGCFYRHRRIAEYWIKTQKGNLFYCNVCKKDEHVYPVECCNLRTGEYLCANCYETDKHYSRRKYAAGQNKDIRQITLNFKTNARPCQIHVFPFLKQENETLGSVYCLVCKLYLCKHCFESHRRLQDVWQLQQNYGPQVQTQVDSSDDIYNKYITPFANHPDRSSSYQVSITNIVWWHFPLAGIIASLYWFCKLERDQSKVSAEVTSEVVFTEDEQLS